MLVALNAGSSTLKYALFEAGDPPHERWRGSVDRSDGADAESVSLLLKQIDERFGLANVQAIGHRFVHGGTQFVAPCLITPEVQAELEKLQSLDPNHLPAELAIVAACMARLPGLPQIACFDTAFHAGLPPVARMLPLPRKYFDQGIRRFGFHGLSYAYLMAEWERFAGPQVVKGRAILAHLGSGSSLAAVHNGQCVDTTMGFTPTGGVMMSTRSGDLDPGVLIHLLRRDRLDSSALDRLINRESGLIGVSGSSADMRLLLAASSTKPEAAEAIELYCYLIRKAIGAFTAVLGGLDTLIFSGGIGEHAAEVRQRICAPLQYLGIELDPERNRQNDRELSVKNSTVTVHCLPTNEEAMIARETARLVSGFPQNTR